VGATTNGAALVAVPTLPPAALTSGLVAHQAGNLPSERRMNHMLGLARLLHTSGLYKTKSPEQAFAVMLIGDSLGLGPTESLSGIHIVEGKPEVSADTQARFIRKHHEWDYEVVTPEGSGHEQCIIELSRNGKVVTRETYTIADAQRAGLANKDIYKKHPRNMLFARCISNCTALHCPEVVGMRVYGEGEISGYPDAPPDPEVFSDSHACPQPERDFVFPAAAGEWGGMTVSAVVSDPNGRAWYAGRLLAMQDQAKRAGGVAWIAWALGRFPTEDQLTGLSAAYVPAAVIVNEPAATPEPAPEVVAPEATAPEVTPEPVAAAVPEPDQIPLDPAADLAIEEAILNGVVMQESEDGSLPLTFPEPTVPPVDIEPTS
jgi:hypothetical protein